MKICYFCDFENFTSDDICERCGNHINGIRHEIFNIAGFIRQNYQLYAIFGILVALYEYLVRAEVPVDQKYVGIFPLIIAFYIILHLTNKAARIIKSKQWQTTEELARRESLFQFIIFSGLHVLLILALLISLPKEARDYMGFFLGMFIFLIFFSATYTYEQNRKTYWILLVSAFLYEMFIFLFIIIPLVAKMTDDALIAFYYTWIAQISLYLAVGGFLAYAVITVGYNSACEKNLSFLAILQKEREIGNYKIELLLGLDILFGLILGMIFFSLKQLYVGL